MVETQGPHGNTEEKTLTHNENTKKTHENTKETQVTNITTQKPTKTTQENNVETQDTTKIAPENSTETLTRDRNIIQTHENTKRTQTTNKETHNNREKHKKPITGKETPTRNKTSSLKTNTPVSRNIIGKVRFKKKADLQLSQAQKTIDKYCSKMNTFSGENKDRSEPINMESDININLTFINNQVRVLGQVDSGHINSGQTLRPLDISASQNITEEKLKHV